MINKGKFENVDGSYIYLHDSNWPFSDYTTEVDVRMDEQDRAGAWGIHQTFTYLGKRIHHFEGDLLADDSGDYWRRRMDFIQALMPHTDNRVAGKLRLELEGIIEEVWCNCTLDGWPELPLESLSPSAGRFLVSFRSFDPRLYGSYLNEFTIDTFSTEKGRVYPKTYPYVYESIGVSSGVAFNAGNAETFPIVEVYGPATNPRIQLDTAALSQPFVQVNTSIISGQKITIDLSEQTVTDNLGVDIYYTIDGQTEWWALKPGNNEVLFLAEDVSAPAKAVVKWYNAYMI